jgi:uncharacterized protein YcbK (DUF882 family)
MQRRTFLRNIAGLGAGILLSPLPVLSMTNGEFWSRPRELWLRRKQTGEAEKVLFWEKGNYLIDGYTRLCELTRDVENNQTVRMKPELFNLLFASQELATAHNLQKWFTITSGYRSIKTNQHTEGAAHNSRHQYGDALDGYRERVDMTENAKLFWALQSGGVGLYKTHVHADTYKTRFWRK